MNSLHTNTSSSDNNSIHNDSTSSSSVNNPPPPPIRRSASNGEISITSTLITKTSRPLSRSKSVEQMQMEAWRNCAKMSKQEAMRAFLVVIFGIAPYWNYALFL